MPPDCFYRELRPPILMPTRSKGFILRLNLKKKRLGNLDNWEKVPLSAKTFHNINEQRESGKFEPE